MAVLPFSALRRQPALAAVRGPVDQSEAAHQPPVLLVREAEPTQPREDVLSELGPLPFALAGRAPDDLARRAHRPRIAVRQLDDPEERVDERVLELDLIEAPVLAAVAGPGDASLDTGGDRALRVDQVHAVERGQVEEVEDPRALHQRLLLLVPGLAAVGGVHDLPELAHDPAVLRVEELDVVEDRVGRGEALTPRDVRLHLDLPRPPRLAAVRRRAEDRAVADRPRVVGIERIQAEQEERLLREILLLEEGVRLLLLPRLAAVR